MACSRKLHFARQIQLHLARAHSQSWILVRGEQEAQRQQIDEGLVGASALPDADWQPASCRCSPPEARALVRGNAQQVPIQPEGSFLCSYKVFVEDRPFNLRRSHDVAEHHKQI